MAKKPHTNGKSNGAAVKSPPRRVADEPAAATPTGRLPVLKTYKIYVGGKFPRTESGRYFVFNNAAGEPVANVCDCSRKDVRDAVVAARTAFGDWSKRTAFNRGQILYRIAEMLEGRASQFQSELALTGPPGVLASARPKTEVQQTVDLLLHYAGWCDKYQQVFSSVNPVSSSFFNFTIYEPTGVVTIVAPNDTSLLGLAAVIAPVIAGGNTCVVLASETNPLPAVTFAEVLATSDLPGGVVNLLTGKRAELVGPLSTHMDVNAAIYCGNDAEQIKTVRANASLNVKRPVIHRGEIDVSPYRILDTQEIKTTWHPIGT